MTIKVLDKSEIEAIYNKYLKHDFPKDELKPLKYINKMYDCEKYECLGFYNDKTFAGYAYMVIPDNSDTRLLDYFAVVKAFRNNGIGGECLKALNGYYRDLKCVILESEHPDYSRDEKDKKIRESRIGFYKRNGLIEADITTFVGGVYYKIFCMECSFEVKQIDVKQEVENIYRTMFSSHQDAVGSETFKRFDIIDN